MQQKVGNIWELAISKVICITTNGVLSGGGLNLVMGKGIALEAKERFPGIDGMAGHLIRQYGNRVHHLGKRDTYEIVTFPTKNHWKDPSNLDLIGRSADQLSALAGVKGWKEVYLPHVGCQNGGLVWEDVYAVLSQILDDRFIAVARS